MKKQLLIGAVLTCSAFASANIATFDTLTEGIFTSLTSEGISFSNYNDYDDFTVIDRLCIDDASGDLAGMEGFSSPNVLNFNGYSPGDGVGFSRLGSFEFGMGPATGASLQFLSFDNAAGSILRLQGLRNGIVVNSATISLSTTFQIHSQTLTLGAGDYDGFRVVAEGTSQNGAVFGVVDNVSVVNPVPEPATLAALGFGLTVLARKRKRTASPTYR